MREDIDPRWQRLWHDHLRRAAEMARLIEERRNAQK